MRTSSLLLTSKIPFSSLSRDIFTTSNSLSNFKQIILNNSSYQKHHCPESILKIARNGLKFQIFDSSYWNHVCDLTINVKDSLNNSQWVELIHIFKRIKVRNYDLYNVGLEQLSNHLNELTLKELSILALSFSYFSICQTHLFSTIAKIVSSRYERIKLKEIETIVSSSSSSAISDTHTDHSSANTAPMIHHINDTVSYIHLIGSYAKCGFDCKPLFEVATDNIVNNINRGVVVPPNLILKLLYSYSRFGYRHSELFDLMSAQIVTSKLSNEELNSIKTIFGQLNYENETLNDIFSYRLGNST